MIIFCQITLLKKEKKVRYIYIIVTLNFQ